MKFHRLVFLIPKSEKLEKIRQPLKFWKLINCCWIWFFSAKNALIKLLYNLGCFRCWKFCWLWPAVFRYFQYGFPETYFEIFPHSSCLNFHILPFYLWHSIFHGFIFYCFLYDFCKYYSNYSFVVGISITVLL